MQVAYEQHGEVGRRPVLMLHGLANSRAFFRPLARLLEQHRHCVLVDIPGFGESPIGPAGLTRDGLVEPLVSLLDELGLTHVELVGHSFGGLVAVDLAAAAQVERLTLISGMLFEALDILRHPATSVRHPALAANLLAQFGGGLVPGDTALMRSAIRSPILRRLVFRPFIARPTRLASSELEAALRGNVGGWSVLRAAGLVGEWDLEERAALVTCPVDLVWGECDRLIGPDDVDRARACLPVARELAIPEVGHWPHLEATSIVADFLN